MKDKLKTALFVLMVSFSVYQMIPPPVWGVVYQYALAAGVSEHNKEFAIKKLNESLFKLSYYAETGVEL